MHKQLKYFKRKKNNLLIVISFSFSVFVFLLLLFYFKKLYDNELLTTILFLLLFAYIFFIVWIRTRLVVYTMNYFYFKMVNDNLGLIEPNKKPYTKNWITSFINDGYERTFENHDFIIYSQFLKKIPNIGKTGYTLVAFVVSKHENYDFYNDELTKQLEILYNMYEYERRVKKQIVIQFKKYETYDETILEELREVINFKNGDHVVINLPVGYFVKENKTYFLRPLKKYFNKYHFYATNLIRKYMNVKENEDE